MAAFHVIASAQGSLIRPEIRTVGFDDLTDALRLGFEDFWAKPSHLVFLGLMSHCRSLFGAVDLGQQRVPVVLSADVGLCADRPVAALGLYEISRRRERGIDTSWHHAFDVLRSPAIPAIPAIAVIGAMLVALFLCWLFAANAIYVWLFGDERPLSLAAFIGEVLTTERGWTLILLGNAIGFIFAAIVLATTVIAFPLLLDQMWGRFWRSRAQCAPSPPIR